MTIWIFICFSSSTYCSNKDDMQFPSLHTSCRKCSCLSKCHFLHSHQWQMTVFISQEGHIFQAVVSGSADRHIIYDGRQWRARGSDMQCTFRREPSKGKPIQLADSWLKSKSWCHELRCCHIKMDCGSYLVDTSKSAAVCFWFQSDSRLD